MCDDSAQLAAWIAGDRQAGDALLSKHFAALHRFFASKIPGEAEDLIQNTMLACVHYRDHVARATSFRAYLFTIAKHQLYAHLRKRSALGDRADFSAMSLVDLGPSLSSVAARTEQTQRLALALERLPLELQLVIELSYWEDLNDRELADVLEVPVGTAKSRLRRARSQLAQEIDRLGAAAARASGADNDEDAAIAEWVRKLRG